MRTKQYVPVVLGVLLFAALAYLFPTTPKNYVVKIPGRTSIVALPQCNHADSIVLFRADSVRLCAIQKLEYLSNQTLYTVIPKPYLQEDSLGLRLYNVKALTQLDRIRARFFVHYFDFFSEFDHQLFMQFLILGGMTFLFVFSLIVGIITRIQMLIIFNFVSAYALLLSVFRYLPVLEYVSRFASITGIAALGLWLLLLLFVQCFHFYATFKPERTWQFLFPKKWFVVIFLFLLLQIFIWDSRVVANLQIGLISALFLYWIYKAMQFVYDYKFVFQVFLILGGFLFGLQWASIFYVGDFAFGFTIDVIVVSYLMFLAFFISRQLLFELKRNIEMNEEIQFLESEMGVRQIVLAENQRKQIVEDLNSDVLKRVEKLTALLHAEQVKYEQIEFESHLTLKSLRNYSYSLFPPYIDQLSLADILKRDFNKQLPSESANIHIDIDDSQPDVHHRDFKLWAYRIFQEYLLCFDIPKKDTQLKVQLRTLKDDTWIYELTHIPPLVAAKKGLNPKSAHLGVYIQYMNAQFEEVYNSPYLGWRFISDFNISKFKD